MVNDLCVKEMGYRIDFLLQEWATDTYVREIFLRKLKISASKARATRMLSTLCTVYISKNTLKDSIIMP